MKTFLIADPHFGHANICRFLRADGTPLRPFTSVEEMDRALINNWNAAVSQEDKVYVLGDVVIHRKALPILYHLNGRKVLIKGNHDIFKLEDYTPFFYDIRAYHVLDKTLLSHIPIHEGSLGRFKGNIHGHLHANVVMKEGKPDPRYRCVSVEQINYTPINWECVRFKGELP